MQEQKFERCGVFTYSLEEGTPAVKLDGHVEEKVKLERQDRLMQIQQEVAFDLTDAKVGTEIDVVLDAEPTKEGDLGKYWIARSKSDAPEIDTNVFVKAGKKGRKNMPLEVGKFVTVRVDETDGYDLIATAISEAR